MAGRVVPALVLTLALGLAPSLPAFAQTPAGSAAPAPAVPAPATSAGPISLTPNETDALQLALIAAKPSLSTVTLASFIFPGSAQVYMGHADHTLAMWGLYLLVFAGAKYFLPDTSLTGGLRTSDVVVAGTFMGIAAGSALDAFLMARTQRDEYDRLINRLADKEHPGIKYIESIPQ